MDIPTSIPRGLLSYWSGFIGQFDAYKRSLTQIESFAQLYYKEGSVRPLLFPFLFATEQIRWRRGGGEGGEEGFVVLVLVSGGGGCRFLPSNGYRVRRPSSTDDFPRPPSCFRCGD